MTGDGLITLTLALAALGAYSALAIIRIRDGTHRRVFFLDVLLIIAALEIVADTLAHAYPEWGWITLATQGALMAGAYGLLITYRSR